MLKAAQNHQENIYSLVKVTGIGSLAIIMIMLSNFEYHYVKCEIIKDINIYLKEKTKGYLVEQSSDSQKEM